VAPVLLRLNVVPWAEVEVDGEVKGTTPMAPIELAPGSHTVVLRHPAFQPLQRIKELRPGETWELEIDLNRLAIAKQP
jgi:hypothetical protein